MSNNSNTDSNPSLSTSPFSSQQEIVEVFSSPVIHAGDIGGSIGFSEKHKKKRSKLIRISGNLNVASSSQSIVYPEFKSTKKQEANAPPNNNIRPCSECGRQFWSWKALFGHMRCHPERQWRGINPPPNYRKPVPLPLPPPSTEQQGLGIVLASNWSTNVEDYEAATCLLMLANGSVPITAQCISWYRDGDSSDAAGYDDREPEPPPQLGFAEGSAPSSSSNSRFECSSCKKVFGSHQALGGHRASHKNVKGCFAMAQSSEDDANCQLDLNHEASRTVGEGDKQEKMAMDSRHKCGICFRVFSTGQALGGHMRCHWEKFEDGSSFHQGPNTSASARDGCVLDLNLPPYPPPVEIDSVVHTGLNSSSSSEIGLDLTLGTILRK